jgi:hypothetical protein
MNLTARQSTKGPGLQLEKSPSNSNLGSLGQANLLFQHDVGGGTRNCPSTSQSHRGAVPMTPRLVTNGGSALSLRALFGGIHA